MLAALVLLVTVPQQRLPLGTAVAVVGGLALAGRRVRALVSAAVVAGCGVLAIFLVPPVAVTFPVLVTVYSLAAHGPAWAGRAGWAATVAGAALWVVVGTAGADPTVGGVAVALGSAVVLATTAWLGGELRRAGRRNVEQLRERARLLEDQQEQRARLAVLAERGRIAREMHDIIARSLSVMIVQADGGRFAAVAPDGGRQAATMFDGIAATGRHALADIRVLLGLLRTDDVAPELGTPKPGIDAIAALVEEVRRAGTSVELHVTGTPHPLPAGAELTVYRAVQEALTNAVKHAGPDAHVEIELAWHRDHLALHVTDDGAGGTPAAGSLGGHGLTGMRERVAAHDGSAEAGPRPDGGFGVHLRLPYPDGPTRAAPRA